MKRNLLTSSANNLSAHSDDIAFAGFNCGAK